MQSPGGAGAGRRLEMIPSDSLIIIKNNEQTTGRGICLS